MFITERYRVEESARNWNRDHLSYAFRNHFGKFPVLFQISSTCQANPAIICQVNLSEKMDSVAILRALSAKDVFFVGLFKNATHNKVEWQLAKIVSLNPPKFSALNKLSKNCSDNKPPLLTMNISM